MNDCDIWQPEEQYKYLIECAKKNGLTTAQALSEAAEVDPGLTSRFKTGKMKNPSLIPVVRLFISAGASLDAAFGLTAAHRDASSTDTSANLPADADDDSLTAEDKAQIEAEMLSLKTENDKLAAELELSRRLLDERNTELSHAHLVIKQRSTLITALMIILVVMISALIGITIYDRLNPHVGWFRDTLAHFQNML